MSFLQQRGLTLQADGSQGLLHEVEVVLLVVALALHLLDFVGLVVSVGCRAAYLGAHDDQREAQVASQTSLGQIDW